MPVDLPIDLPSGSETLHVPSRPEPELNDQRQCVGTAVRNRSYSATRWRFLVVHRHIEGGNVIMTGSISDGSRSPSPTEGSDGPFPTVASSESSQPRQIGHRPLIHVLVTVGELERNVRPRLDDNAARNDSLRRRQQVRGEIYRQTNPAGVRLRNQRNDLQRPGPSAMRPDQRPISTAVGLGGAGNTAPHQGPIGQSWRPQPQPHPHPQ